METLNFPCVNERWRITSEIMRQYICDWEDKILTIDDIISLLRNILKHLYGHQPNVFKGLGVFLMQLNNSQRDSMIKINFKNILTCAMKLEHLSEIRFLKGSIYLSTSSVKSILACSIMCLQPNQNNDYYVGSNNFDQIYANIIMGSKKHFNHLVKVLSLFSECEGKDDRGVSIFSFSNVINSTDKAFNYLWPVLFSQNFQKYDFSISSTHWSQLWPCYSQKTLPYIDGPKFISPILLNSNLQSIIYTPSAVHVIGFVSTIDPWNLSLQFSQNHIINNITSLISCLLHLDNMNSSSVSGFSKRPRSSSNSDFSIRRQSSTVSSRSSRHHSYSSSSRSGSLQISNSSAANFSSTSSRRSSGRDDERFSDLSAGVGATVGPGNSCASNTCSASNVAVNSRVQQPVIEEEEESLLRMTYESHMGHLMRAPITDSSKLSLSQELLDVFKEAKSYSTCRRNSSPLLQSHHTRISAVGTGTNARNIYAQPVLANKPSTKLKASVTGTAQPDAMVQQSSRCCGEDALSIRMGNIRRRQSLPCHLLWPNNQTGGSMMSEASASLLSASAIPQISAGHSSGTSLLRHGFNGLENLIEYVDSLIADLLKIDRSGEDNGLACELLRRRREDKSAEGNLKNPEIQFTNYGESLVSQDLAQFDKELFSSTFFDDEADECFRKFSNMISPSSTTLLVPNLNGTEMFKETSILNAEDQCTDTCNLSQTPINLNHYTNFADSLTTNIIVDSLTECRFPGKTVQPPIVIHRLPIEYDETLSICIRIIVSAAVQSLDNPRIVVLDSVNELVTEKILSTIASLQNRMSVSQFYSATLAYFSETNRERDFTDFLKEFISQNQN